MQTDSKTKTALSMIAIAALVAACNTPTMPIAAQKFSAAASPAPATISAPAVQRLTDGTYKGMVDGQIATLEILNGQPAKYHWGRFWTQLLTMEGNLITIDKRRGAYVTYSDVTPNSFTADWEYKSVIETSTMTKV